ncbi:MAG: hypothetical protein V3V71_18190 [Roseateles sp.]|jgi:hypothetical protein|nr:hypothetical protein [Methylibium sp.]MBY0368548.1 hypothetical protein [Burkholderiaceae bacterium]|mmetsp:Transcript_897/g.2135  ORF Transcript_897/g.2135 Transcript_897/m.2135 type:complete len:142 (-) Transcript_897:70-495(-)
MKPLIAALILALGLSSAQAQSEASGVSVAPVALSVAAVSATGAALSVLPSALLVAGATLTVVSVEVVGGVTVWVLERASDGVRLSLRTAGQLAKGLAVSAGTVVTVSVIGTGALLSAAGEVIAFIPNEIGKALLYNEQVSR